MAKSRQKNDRKTTKDPQRSITGLLIAGCLMLGFGVGFLIDNVPAGLFAGLGIGLLIAAFVRMRAPA